MAISSFLGNIFRRRKKKSTDFVVGYFASIFEFDFETIRTATNEFAYIDLIAPGNRCGIGGGYGPVYKGKLQSGQEIAVTETLSRTQSQRDFVIELDLLSKLRHNNLIRLIGFCSKQDQHFLVYEFVPNSSLDSFIFDPQRASRLSWEIYQNIVEGIARGLRYLHQESGLRVVHRDIKPANIFLDSQMKPKIAGFGLARLMQDVENEPESIAVDGSLGYIDPNYYRTGHLSVKTDIYAFGVAILTIISRRKPLSGEEILLKYVNRLWNRGEAIDIIPELMRQEEREESISEILRYIHIALLCVDENEETRPSLDEVLHWFSCNSTPLPELTIGNGNQLLVAEETNRSLSLSSSPSLSPGHNSVTSSMSRD